MKSRCFQEMDREAVRVAASALIAQIDASKSTMTAPRRTDTAIIVARYISLTIFGEKCGS